jgi:hypothetical protein
MRKAAAKVHKKCETQIMKSKKITSNAPFFMNYQVFHPKSLRYLLLYEAKQC